MELVIPGPLRLDHVVVSVSTPMISAVLARVYIGTSKPVCRCTGHCARSWAYADAGSFNTWAAVGEYSSIAGLLFVK